MNNILFRPTHRNANPEFNRLIGEVFNRPMSHCVNEKAINKSYAFANIEDKDEKYVVSIAAPGFTREQITIKIDENKMVVTGKQPANTKTKYHLREFNFSEWTRSFNLPKEVNTDQIEATFVNGILSISIPKVEKPAPKSVEVK